MKKVFIVVVVGLTIIGSGLFVGNLFFSKGEEKEPSTTITTTEELKPELFLDIEILESNQKSQQETTINELYRGELDFQHANPTKPYLITVQFIDKEKREFVGPDKQSLHLEKEVTLGKEQGTVFLVVKGNKPMLAHIQQLKDVQVSASLKEKE
ncbi:hypothetical protein ACK4CS_01210 [Enterococcus gallinarum]|uniref:Uncharacterized protein n=1 Tax=Enterococcus gallinarum TaxID=1353 RepID=A0A376GT70_ENTGA|nr:hypothetical protein [Enterococcus gallinarum]MCO5478357.1 hypothetical protein [Enterococcus gallinarum]MDT2686204.1 hypothetical protein [Enterococcus gallinarum]OJG40779.1 hypothetical protein RV03_GL003343 [Enterococcus gallinarum]STD81757.1 Uncharacterised protein [Enterococcus gallinarum]STE01169.1 Uncharacterised protein [Enterococcus gallinarum]